MCFYLKPEIGDSWILSDAEMDVVDDKCHRLGCMVLVEDAQVAQFEINTVQRITEGARGIGIGQRLIVIREKRQASPGSKLQTHCYYNPVLLAENPPCSLKLKVTSLNPTTDWTWRGFERFYSEHSLNRTYAAAQASQ